MLFPLVELPEVFELRFSIFYEDQRPQDTAGEGVWQY
jgi:hypothetical protein